jgi:valyl-tRNA synthetase
MTEDGHMNELAGRFEGLTAEACRTAAVDALQAEQLIETIEPYNHNVGTCYRCNTTVDPRISEQWFVRMKPLAEPAIAAVRKGETRFVPDRYSKIYFNWMENIRDWCISRQLWWGHRIPAYYCQNCGGIHVGRSAPATCAQCGGHDFVQDEDTLDTWFSSALWPFSTLGWPEQTADLSYFYPTSTLVTGYDIIFFWVARMIFSGLEQTGEVPFRDVYIHGRCPNHWATALIRLRSSMSIVRMPCAMPWLSLRRRAMTSAIKRIA